MRISHSYGDIRPGRFGYKKPNDHFDKMADPKVVGASRSESPFTLTCQGAFKNFQPPKNFKDRFALWWTRLILRFLPTLIGFDIIQVNDLSCEVHYKLFRGKIHIQNVIFKKGGEG